MLLPAAEYVYFAFPSGRLTYDCAACGAKCCRGFGYLVSNQALRLQAGKRPTLPLFATLNDECPSMSLVGNCAPECFFLSADSRCEIHAEHGFEAKPETCRLFPFNHFRQVGDYLIVAPHSSLCPLAVVPTSTLSACSDHDTLMRAMASQGIQAPVGRYATADSTDMTIALERDIVSACNRHPADAPYLDFVQTQIELTRRSFPARPLAADSLDRVLALMRCIDGAPDPARCDADLAQTLVACTPFLRANLVFSGPLNAASRQVLPGSLPVEQLPLAMAFIAWLSQAARNAGMAQVSFQTISKLEMDARPLVLLFANAGAILAWDDRPLPDPCVFELADDRAAFIRLSRALLPGSQVNERVPLGALIQSVLPPDSVHRIAFLKRVAGLLAGRLRTLDHSPNRLPATFRQRLRGSLDRLVMSSADNMMVESYFNAAARRRGP